MRRDGRAGIRCHRTATGYYTTDGVRQWIAVLSQRLRNPTAVAGAIVIGGVVCWVLAFAMAGLPEIPWSVYDFGSTVLIVSGFTTLVTVMVLVSTVLRDDGPSRPVGGPHHLAAWHRRWRYQGRHQGLVTSSRTLPAMPWARGDSLPYPWPEGHGLCP
jgi:hypothetical protein